MSRAPFDQLVTFLSVADLDAADAFYGSLLGLPLVLDQGACRIYRVAETSFLGVCHNPELAGASEGTIVTLVTDDVDAVHERLAAAAVTVDHLPAYNRRFDIYHCFVRDPDGHRIEIQQFRDPRWPRAEAP
jgi:catechol 2,3-dioxygenase-like lactoylglutathione lyase family enzyme